MRDMYVLVHLLHIFHQVAEFSGIAATPRADSSALDAVVKPGTKLGLQSRHKAELFFRELMLVATIASGRQQEHGGNVGTVQQPVDHQQD